MKKLKNVSVPFMKNLIYKWLSKEHIDIIHLNHKYVKIFINRKHQCPHCQKKFGKKSVLKDHIRILA